MATYTFVIQRLQIWPGDEERWAALDTPDLEVGVVEWDGLARELGMKVLEKFGEDTGFYGIDPSGFRAVVREGDHTGNDLDGDESASATVRGYGI